MTEKGILTPLVLAGILILICTLHFTHVFGVTAAQLKVDTGNSALDQKINAFYKMISQAKRSVCE
jgi:hypothetical protein